MKKSSEYLRDSFIKSLSLCLMISFIFSGIFFLYNEKSSLKRENAKVQAKLDYHMDDLVGSYTLDNQKALLLQIEYVFQETPVDCVMFNKQNQSIYIKGSPNTCNRDLSVLDITSGGLSIGKVYYHVDLRSLESKLYVIPLILLVVFTSLMLVSIVNFKSIVSSLINPLTSLINNINSLDELENFKTENHEINVLKEKIIENQLMIQESASREVYHNLARQVAHDIKSPLTALDMLVSDLADVEKEKLTLLKNSVQRIKDISNNLYSSSFENTDAQKKTLIVNITEEIVSEKRINFKNKDNLELILNVNDGCYDLFVEVVPTELKRVLSNIIENAIQACSAINGVVHVTLSRENTFVKISISDNGIGIKKEYLSKIFENGFTTKSESGGKGLGLYHAKSTVESFGGSIQIDNEAKHTSFDILLPIVNKPDWFCSNLSIHGNRIIIVDDDKTIHQLWNKKLTSLLNEKVYFTSPQEFLDFKLDGTDLVLIDYEFIGSILNGLDLIERKRIKNAILITSHFNEEELQRKALELSVKIIPKNILPFLNINKNSRKRILIDDDKLIQLTWRNEAKKKNIDLDIYSSYQEFKQELDKYSNPVTIYIDSELGNEKGEEAALELYNNDFKDIHLVTGHHAENFKDMYWLKSINDKSPSIL